MKWVRFTERVIESILFVFCGFLVKVAFSRQLDYVSNILLFVGALIIIAYIMINNIKESNINQNV